MTEAQKKKNRQAAAKLPSPKPRELPSGSWRCEVMVDGKRMSVVDDDPAVAHAKALALKTGILKAKNKPESLTVGEAIDRYIESKSVVLSPATIAGYKRIRKNALQDIMDIRLGALRREDIQKAVNKMAKDKSPKTVRNAHGLLTAALEAYAPDMAIRTTLPQKRKYEAAVPSGEDIKKILAFVKGTKDELFILLAIWLGLRMSEIRGLKWSDVDGDTLHIRRALVDEGEKTTKTYSSQRELPIPPYIKSLLNTTPKEGEYIVPKDRRYLYDRFQIICRDSKVSKHYRFHDLRHINASVMLAQGVPNKYAQQRMGHATDNMLKTVYQHTMDEEMKKFSAKIDNYFESLL